MIFFVLMMLAALLTICLYPFVARLARKKHIVSIPRRNRDIHHRAVALLGGIPIVASIITLTTVLYIFQSEALLCNVLAPKHIIGFMVACAVVVLGGALDDRFDQRPLIQLFWTFLGTLVIILSGIGIH